MLIRSFLILPFPMVTRCTLDRTAGTPRRTSGSAADVSWIATPRSSLKPTVVSVGPGHVPRMPSQLRGGVTPRFRPMADTR